MTKFYLIAYEIYLKIVFLTNLIKPNTRITFRVYEQVSEVVQTQLLFRFTSSYFLFQSINQSMSLKSTERLPERVQFSIFKIYLFFPSIS